MDAPRPRFGTLLVVVAVIVVAVLAQRADRWAARGSPTEGVGLPGVSPAPALYPEGVAISLQPYQARGQIVLSVDGSVPTARVGVPYEGPVRFAGPGVGVLRVAEIVGEGTGPIFTGSYVVGMAAKAASTVPIVSLVVEPGDLWDEEHGILANPDWRGRDWERPAHATFFLGSETYPADMGVRVDSDGPPGAAKPSLRLYTRQAYGDARLEAPLFPSPALQSAARQSYRRLLLQAGTHEVVWSSLRDQVLSDVARDMGLPAAEGRFVWLFLNGDSWGIYRLTERVDRFMLADGLGVTPEDVVQEGNPREGTDDDWDDLVDWARGGGVSTESGLAALGARVDLGSLADFAILQQLFGFPSDALIAVRPRGGRWFWVYEGAAYPGGPRTGSDFETLVSAALADEGFRTTYLRRAVDLANTTLEPSSVARYIDPIAASLVDHAAYEQARWPGVPSWPDELAALEVVTADLWQRMADWLGMTGTLSLHVVPPGAGRLYLDGLRVVEDPMGWHGLVAAGVPVSVAAVPESGYVFGGWSGAAEGRQTSLTVTSDGDTQLTARFEPRSLGQPDIAPDDVVINEVWINDDGTSYPSLGYRELEGDWVELLVRSASPVDLRGWRLTDNDAKTSTEEGSLVLPAVPELSAVPCGTVILVVATVSDANSAAFPADDLDLADRRLVLYAGNGALDAATDPGFGLSPRDENLVLLAPGPTSSPGDDVAIDFVAEGLRVTPHTFGALADGVTFDVPFYHLGQDDGAVFLGRAGNDAGGDWLVDPTACQSYDATCLDTPQTVSPGQLNSGQALLAWGCALRRLQP